MAFKFIVLAAFVACARAGAIGYAAPALHAAPLAYSAGPAYHAAPVAYSAAPAIHAAPVAYKTPLAYAAAPALHAAPVAYAPAVAKTVVAKTVDDEYDPNPQYSYSYDVHDTLTGDAKTQQETRDGDVVHGSYSLLEADGTKRIVEYTADPHNGFNAVVHKEPATVAVKAVAPVVAKVATPVIAAHAAPYAVAHGAPATIIKSHPYAAHGYY